MAKSIALFSLALSTTMGGCSTNTDANSDKLVMRQPDASVVSGASTLPPPVEFLPVEAESDTTTPTGLNLVARMPARIVVQTQVSTRGSNITPCLALGSVESPGEGAEHHLSQSYSEVLPNDVYAERVSATLFPHDEDLRRLHYSNHRYFEVTAAGVEPVSSTEYSDRVTTTISGPDGRPAVPGAVTSEPLASDIPQCAPVEE